VLLFVLGSVLLFATGERVARAASFEVSPVSLSLSAATTTGIVTVTNLSKEPVRLQVTGFAWGQGPDGEIQLTPSDEITFFPALVALKEGESRKLRVGVKAAPGPLEKTYRIFVEELPGVAEAKPGQVAVRTRMGIPVFLAPVGGDALPHVEGMLVRGTKLAFTVRNGGTVHFVARKMTVVGHTKSGDKLFELEKDGWYILAGGTRDYDVELPDGACKLLQSAEVVIETGDGSRVRSPPSPVACVNH
jgi:fimbrial chaperone protein